jgi:hypothetical protein
MALGVMLAAACNDTPVTTAPLVEPLASVGGIPASGLAIGGHEPVSATERTAARLLARAIAMSLRDPAVAEYIKTALASSAVREQKLHFASFLAGRGGRLVAGMLRDGQITAAQLSEAVRSIRDLEFYMPVQAHRDHWTGSESPLVAIALREEEPPDGYDRDGTQRILSRLFPPAQPVLVLAPVETNLRAQIELNSRGQSERACAPRRSETLTAAAQRCAGQSSDDRLRPLNSEVPAEVTGLYVTSIALAGDQCGGECWAWGNPEYQIITFAITPASAPSHLRVIQCSGDEAADAYRWNMDGRTWGGMGLLLTRDQMNAALQLDSGWVHQFWEDDQDNCNFVPKVDAWAEAFKVAWGVTYLAIRGHHGLPPDVGAAKTLADGIQGLVMGGDDYIGCIIHESASQFGDGLGSTHNMVVQRGDNGSVFVGRATINMYTASGPYIGPVARVIISQPSSTMFPLGSGIQLSAYGLDAYDNHVPERPVSWSSANPSVASVDANGFVTGHQEGSASITATVDGVSASITVYPKAIGAPVAVRISHEFVTLPPGQWMYVYARLYDSNGFEVPVNGNYLWSSADQSSCQVGYGAVDGEAYLVGNGGMGALITVTSAEGLEDTVYCSVNGGDAKIPARKRRLEPALPRALATPRLNRPASRD